MDEKVKAAKKTADGVPDSAARGLLPPFGRGAEIIETHSRARLDTDDFGRCVLRPVRDAVFFEALGSPDQSSLPDLESSTQLYTVAQTPKRQRAITAASEC